MKSKLKPTHKFKNYLCVCVSLCTTVAQHPFQHKYGDINTAQNRSDNFPFQSPDNHQNSDAVLIVLTMVDKLDIVFNIYIMKRNTYGSILSAIFEWLKLQK